MFFTFCFLSILVIVIINTVVDPGNIYFRNLKPKLYDTYIEELISSEYGLRQIGWNERQTKVALAKKAGQYDCVFIGSSRVANISSHRYPKIFSSHCESLINLSVSGGSLEDMIIFSDIIKSNKQYPKTIFVGIDPWLPKFLVMEGGV